MAEWQKAGVVPQRIPDLEGSRPAETSSDGAASLALRLARAGHAGSVSQAGMGRHFLTWPPAACAARRRRPALGRRQTTRTGLLFAILLILLAELVDRYRRVADS